MTKSSAAKRQLLAGPVVGLFCFGALFAVARDMQWSMALPAGLLLALVLAPAVAYGFAREEQKVARGGSRSSRGCALVAAGVGAGLMAQRLPEWFLFALGVLMLAVALSWTGLGAARLMSRLGHPARDDDTSRAAR